MNSSLPMALQENFAGLARRIRLAQVLRGVSWLVVALLVGQTLLFALDSLASLEPRGYRLGLLALLTVGAFVLLTCLVLPLLRPLPLAVLAALVEDRHPELQEKLLSAVDFTHRPDAAHGSALLIGQIIEDAEQASRAIDFRESFSLRSGRRWAKVAGLALLVSLVCSLFFPAYAGFQCDLWLAWSLPSSAFALEVTPGTKVVSRDRPAKIAVQTVSLWHRAVLPRACFLVLHDPVQAGRPHHKVPMNADGEGGFSFTIEQPAEEQAYHIEAGSLASDTFQLTAVEPIRVTSNSLMVHVTPPPYVNAKMHPPQNLPDPGYFLALQYSGVRVAFQVNRAPRKSHLLLSAEDKPDAAQKLPITWKDGRLDGTVDMIASKPGKYSARLVFEDEHELVFELAVSPWTVWKDEPPVVREAPFRGKTARATQNVAPDDRLPLRINVEDSVGLDSVELEYRVNDGPVVTAPLVAAPGKVLLNQDIAFPLAGKVKEGDDFNWRLKITDNRRLTKGQIGASLPDRDLGPQSVYEPTSPDGKERWQSLKIMRQADPLLEQNILAQREDVRKKIDAIKKQLDQERAQLGKAKVGMHQQPFLTPNQAQEIEQVRAKNKANQDALRKLGWELSADPFLQLLAEKPLALAENEMKRSDTQLSQAGEKKLTSEAREIKLTSADQELVQTLKGLEKMQEANDRLAQDRLDQARMELLAQKQQDLAKRAEELARLDLSKDPKAKEELARLQEEQARLAAELERLAQSSKIFQEALQAARVQQAQKLAKQAESMAQTQRELFQATQKALAQDLQKRFAELAKKQEALAGHSAELAREAKIPVGETPPRFEEAKGAAAALREGQAEKALRDQGKTITDLERLGESLGRGLLLGRNAREGAQNLVRFQDRLHKELERLGEDFPRLTPAQVKERVAAVNKSQQVLQETVGRLEIPAELKEAAAQRAQAQDLTAQVSKAFRVNAFAAYEKMKEAHEALQKLAQLLPADLAPANPKDTPLEKIVRAQADQAGTLGKEQKDLRDEVLKLLGQAASGDEGKGDSPLAGMKGKQDDLQKETDKLGQELMQLSQKEGTKESKMAGEEASRAADEAVKAMAQSKEKMKEGKLTEAEKLAEEAALKLEMAAKRAAEAAQEMQANAPPQTSPDKDDATAKSLTEAREQMNQAQKQLQQSQPQAAQPAMEKSAEALMKASKKAGEQLMQSKNSSSSESGKKGAPAGGQPTTDDVLAKELMKYGAASWGDLPGELRTRIVLDMRARYGEDYARIIQGYFQGIAEAPNSKGK